MAYDEGAEDYKLDFIEHVDPSLDPVEHDDLPRLYELVALPILIDRVRQLQIHNQTAKISLNRLISRVDVLVWTFDADPYLLFGGRLFVPEAIRDEILQEFKTPDSRYI